MADINLGGSVSTTGTAILGKAAIVMANADYTLAVAEYTNQALIVTSSTNLTTQRDLKVPLTAGVTYIVQNNTSGSQAIRIIGVSGGTGVVVANAGTVSVFCDGTNIIQPVSATTFAGDLSGNSTSQTVVKINGSTVSTAGGALTTGNVLRVTGASTVDYGAVNLASSNAVTGTLPTANQAAQTLSGDVTGNTGASVVAKANGATVPTAGSLTTGNVLQVSGSSALTYAPLNLAGGSNYVTGTLPTGNLPSLAGDVTGAPAANTVTKVQNRSVNSTAPTDGYALIWDQADGYWLPYPLATLQGIGTENFGGTGSVVSVQATETVLNSTSSTAKVRSFAGHTAITTDGTTWVTIASFNPGTNSLHDWSVSVCAWETALDGYFYRADLNWTSYRLSSTPVYSPSTPAVSNARSNGTLSSCSVQYTNSTNTTLVQVRGVAATTINWACMGQIQRIS